LKGKSLIKPHGPVKKRKSRQNFQHGSMYAYFATRSQAEFADDLSALTVVSIGSNRKIL
jgi:hypothetical protein